MMKDSVWQTSCDYPSKNVDHLIKDLTVETSIECAKWAISLFACAASKPQKTPTPNPSLPKPEERVV